MHPTIIRVDGGATGLLNIRRGMRLRIHGFLQSADFRESLEKFLEKANKYSGSTVTVEVKDAKPNQVLTIRNTVEVVSRRIIVLENNSERRAKPRTNCCINGELVITPMDARE